MALSYIASTVPSRHSTFGTPRNFSHNVDTSATCPRIRSHRCKAAEVAAALMLGFLPWNGCSQGGFYSTGIEGSHGQGCQAIYQPAAAAEARFAATQQQRWSHTQSVNADREASDSQIAVNSGLALSRSSTGRGLDSSINNSNVAAASLSSDQEVDASSNSRRVDGQTSPAEPLKQGPAVVDMQEVPEAIKDLVREILRDDNRARTKQLVDDAWQTLE